MPAFSSSIPNLVGGVSQQPPEIRPTNASSNLRNSTCSVLAGLGKRPASEHIGSLPSFDPTDDTAELNFKGQDGVYRKIFANSGYFSIINLSTGLEEPVTYSGLSRDYLDTIDFTGSQIGFLPVQDTVFVYNREKIVTASTKVETGDRFDPNLWATVWVKQANQYSNYSIYRNGSLIANVATGTNPEAYATDQLATLLKNALVTAGYTVYQNGTVLEFNITAGDTIETRDGLGGEGLKHFTTSADQFTDLPPDAFQGRVLRINGDVEDGGDDYYVVRSGTSWQETYGWEQGRTFDASTMPHTLVYNGDGTWTFEEHEWTDRNAGDDDSNADPSFVGSFINKMFLLKGRLGILTGENVVFSVSDAFEDFYRYSCTQLQDDDRIDLAVDGSKQRGDLNHVVYNQDEVIIFSEDAQFKLTYTDSVLGPNTIDLKETTSYTCSGQCEPSYVGPNVVFVDGFSNSVYDSLREYSVNQNSLISEAQEITSDVPEYIPAGVYKIESSQSENCLVLLTGGDRSKIWYYQYFFNSEGKVQSSWQTWDMEGTTIYDASFIQDKLYISYIFNDDDSNLQISRVDPTLYLDTDFSLDRVLLDHSVNSADLTSTFDGTDTTVTLPYTTGSVVATIITDNGRVYDSASSTGQDHVFEGVDLSSATFVAGVRYTFEWELSPIYFRDDKQVAIQDGRFTLNYISLLTNATSYFKYDVTPPSRTTTTSTYVARGFSADLNNFGSVSIANEEVSIAVFGEGSKSNVKINSDSPYPVRFSNLEWRGMYRPRTKRK